MLSLNSFAQTKPTKPVTKKTNVPVKLKPKAKEALLGFSNRPYTDSISLRWSPANPQIWELGKRYGYHIYRSVLKDSNSISEFIRITDEPVRPISQDDYLSNYKGDTITQHAGYNIFSFERKSNNINEAVNNNKTLELNYITGIIAANTYPIIAKLSGMYFTDKNISSGKNYIYEIRLASEAHPEVKAQTKAFTTTPYYIPKVYGITGKGRRKTAFVKWRNDYDKFEFAYFTIFRSEFADRNFQKINKKPFLPVTMKDDNPDYLEYQDALPAVDKSYYYYVVGTNTFGDRSQNSDTVQIKATISLFDNPSITEIFSTDNETVQVFWELNDPVSKRNLQGYFVQRTRDPGSKKYLTLNKSPLITNSFVDPSPLSTGYYRIAALGIAGDTTFSLNKAYQLIDTIPPKAPVILEAYADTNNLVHIKWRSCKELDLDGYRVFRSNAKHEEFKRITPGVSMDTFYVDTVSKKLSYRKIYYKIIALDNHENPSKIKKPIEVPLIDIVPPIPPQMVKTKVEKNKVFLSWKPSLSEDVAKMVIMRRLKYEYDWHTLFTLKGDSIYSFTSFTDSLLKPGNEYYYLVQATDIAGLVSSLDNMVLVETPRERIKPIVEQFNAIPAQANNFIKLSWEYKAQGVNNFAIYRKTDAGKLILFETLPGTNREYYDKKVQPSTVYTYYIQAYFVDYGQSPMVGPLEVKY